MLAGSRQRVEDTCLTAIRISRQNNILSVVFLGIGVLCLIAIVILLVVKPKDKAVLEAEKARQQELKEKRENRK